MKHVSDIRLGRGKWRRVSSYVRLGWVEVGSEAARIN